MGDYIDDVKQKLELAEAIKRSFTKIGDLPEWMQVILFEDILGAIENRVRTMDLILHEASGK